MKKSLLTLALLGATALTAQAANVTLYGAVDAGFVYEHNNADGSSNSFKLADGISGANNLGLKGEEEIGDLTVGFQLVNEFSLANGQMDDSKRLFSSEARLYVAGPFGEVAAGRFGALDSGAGSYDIFFSNVDAFDGGDQLPTGLVKTPTLNNALLYKTPTLGGFTGYAQYSFSTADSQANKWNRNARFAAFGATFEAGPAVLATTVSVGLPNTLNEQGKALQPKAKKPLILGLGGNFKVNDDLQLYAGLQYAKHIQITLGSDDPFEGTYDALEEAKDETYKLIGGTVGANYTFGNSTVTAATYFVRAKDLKTNTKGRYLSLQGRYTYALSNRTSVYAGANAGFTKTFDSDHVREYTLYSGLRHEF